MQETCKRVNRQFPEENGRKPRSGDEEEEGSGRESGRGAGIRAGLEATPSTPAHGVEKLEVAWGSAPPRCHGRHIFSLAAIACDCEPDAGCWPVGGRTKVCSAMLWAALGTAGPRSEVDHGIAVVFPPWVLGGRPEQDGMEEEVLAVAGAVGLVARRKARARTLVRMAM